MCITNNPEIAVIAEQAGADRIMIDMETYKKAERQGGMDTVQNRHTLQDISRVRKVLKKAELVVRINPIHGLEKGYTSSEQEVNDVLSAGADCIMLPYFKGVGEVRDFLGYLNGRAKNILLLETADAVDGLDEILECKNIDEIHIGLNDLSLCFKKRFMFEVLADGTVEKIVEKLRKKGIPYGIGGVASVGNGDLPAEKLIGEYYRLGSQAVILSRSFCDTSKEQDFSEIRRIFKKGIRDIRLIEDSLAQRDDFLLKNQQEVKRIVEEIVYKRK